MLDSKNRLLLEHGDSTGVGGAVIQFGWDEDVAMGGAGYLEGGTKLTVRQGFGYKEKPGNTIYESGVAPHIERIMADLASVVQAYIENLTVSSTLKLPDEIWSDAKTHVAMINSNGEITTSTINSTELYRLLGATSNIQDQLDAITNALAIKYINSGNMSASMVTGTPANITSIELPEAGTYLLVGGVRYTPGNGATLSATELCISTSTNFNTNPTNYVKQQESNLSSGTAALSTVTIATVSAKTTYYLNGRVNTTGSSAATALGRLFAVKIPKM